MNEEQEKKLEKLIAVQLENQPSVESDRFFVGDSDTVETGTSLTLTFEISKLYVVRLVEGYCDARTGFTYQWIIDGKSLPLNQFKYHLGKVVHSQIQLIITNPTGSDQSSRRYFRKHP
ncbi:hypothetical protein ES708_16265 [subsurface metagenome]